MNPLLQTSDLPGFDRIKAEHVVPAVKQTLKQARERIDTLLSAGEPYDWDNLAAPLESLEAHLHQVFSPVSHLNAVVNSEVLRAAYNECLPLLSAFDTEMGQHQGLYEAVRSVADREDFEALSTAQRKAITNRLRDFRLSGIDLPAEQKQRFKEIRQRLSALQARFQENVLDATDAWKKHITDESELNGLPQTALSLAAQKAALEGLEGFVITLESPSYLPVITYVDDRELRKEVYTAFSTRASDRGPHAGQWDNSEVMEEILALRHESAQLLGFENFAQLSLETKMATSPQQVMQFLDQLADRSLTQARREYGDLNAFARSLGFMEPLQAWDLPYFSEKLRQQRYAISQEELKPYFPDSRVIDGLFGIAQQLYGIRIEERFDVSVWHEDVRFFEISEADGTPCGRFYFDLYARTDKRGGAWMDDHASRMPLGDSIQLPVAYLTCNFSPPIGDQPALLTHTEVITLFHEFGHGLHHMLTRIDVPSVSGINGVAWDAVELPSQFMENWCWDEQALALFAHHFETNEQLPSDLLKRLQAARNFQSAMQMVRQLEFALFDMRIHEEYQIEKGGRIQEILEDVRKRVAVFKSPDFNRFAHGFSHIFGSGYAAGYYSYKWAEVLSADAFSLFEEEGIFDTESGRRFRDEVLSMGGSKEPLELYVAYRGREPDIAALLRHTGLDQPGAASG